MEQTFRYSRFVDEPDSTHNLVMSLVPPGARVLEFGCATGYMSEMLRSRLGCSVTGIEIEEEAAELAREHCDRVIVGNADDLDLAALFPDQQFDVIMFADVLEHLQHPDTVLRQVAPLVASTGKIVVSIPNVAHGSVRLSLLSGEFRYRPSGILDETHIRFFTRSSLQELFESSGYLVTRWLRKHIDIGRTEINVSAAQVSDELWRQLNEDPESTTYQFVVQAVPTDTATVMHDLRTDMLKSQDELREIRRVVAERDEQLLEMHARVQKQQDEYDHDIGERDAQIANLEQRMEDLEQVVQQSEQALQKVPQLYAVIEQRDKHLAEREQHVAHLEATIAAMQQQLRERDATAADLRNQLTKIERSRMWKVAQSYWRLKKHVARAKGRS